MSKVKLFLAYALPDKGVVPIRFSNHMSRLVKVLSRLPEVEMVMEPLPPAGAERVALEKYGIKAPNAFAANMECVYQADLLVAVCDHGSIDLGTILCRRAELCRPMLLFYQSKRIHPDTEWLRSMVHHYRESRFGQPVSGGLSDPVPYPSLLQLVKEMKKQVALFADHKQRRSVVANMRTVAQKPVDRT